MNITLSNGKIIPMEMHKVRIVQKINLAPVARLLDHATPHCGACSQRDLRADRFDGRGPNPGYSIEIINRRKRTVLLPVVDNVLRGDRTNAL